MSELDSDFDFDAHLAAYEDSRQLTLEVTGMVDDLTFGFRGLDPQTNAARVEFLEHQLALPAGERDELVTTSRLGDEWEQVAQELVEGGGDIGAFVRREYPASAAEVTRGISEATADWPVSLSPADNTVERETPQVSSEEHEHQPTPDDDTVGQGGVTPDEPTSEDEQVEPDDLRVVVDVDHHIRQSAALAARAGRLLGAPVRGARAVAGGVASVADALTPKSPLVGRATRLAQQAGSMASDDMDDHPIVNHTRSPGMHR